MKPIQNQGQANQVLVALLGDASGNATLAVTDDGDVYHVRDQADRDRIAAKGLEIKAERAPAGGK